MLNIDGMQLDRLRSVKSGNCGGTDIYRDVSEKSGALYTVVTAVGERERCMMAVAAEELKRDGGKVAKFVGIRSESDRLMLVFRYNTERLLLTFAPKQCPLAEQKIELCKKLVRECISMRLPYWLLELALREENINLEQDNSVNINIFVNPEQARERADEKLCTAACADIICKILEQLPKKQLKACKTYWLVYKKKKNYSHTTLLQLYRDIEDSCGESRSSIFTRIKQYVFINKDELFVLGKRLAVVLVVLLLILLLQRLFFSKVSLFGFRYTGLKQIGTVLLK